MIPVTKPFLPPRKEYEKYIKDIWTRNWLTNNGPLVNELELKLKDHLGVEHLIYTSNGTVSLQIALKALEIQGEVITTPFSYIATASSIFWESCKPVFSDIDSGSFNIDPAKIEDAITQKTTAILATHVFGNPCEIEKIQKIAGKYNLKVIYDAAHCFGVKYMDKSIFEFGDVSSVSFHATKLYHSIEGGALITPSADLLKRMAYMRNFGHDGPWQFKGVGINGKNSEVHAAMGLVNLKHIKKIISRRKEISELYHSNFENSGLRFQKWNKHSQNNFAYYPVLFQNEEELLSVLKNLNDKEVFARRYFYPSLNELDYLKQTGLPVSEDISRRILCLPLYFDLSDEEVDMICRIILRTLRYS